MTARTPPLLEVEGITTGYGRVEVLHDLSLQVPPGTVVAVLGANGVGKTTLLRALAGVLPLWGGRIRLQGSRIDGRSPYAVNRTGVTLIPEGRGIFPGLSVEENLAINARSARSADRDEQARRLEQVLTTFPRLAERLTQRAGSLSGGEQQMLALSRAFMADPVLLAMDEISMGLAPIIVEDLFEKVAALKAQGQAMLIVEQYLTYALTVADYCYVMAKGRVVLHGTPAELEAAGATSTIFV